MKRTKFIFTEDYQRAVDAISDINTKAELILAISDYGINGNEYQGDNEIVKVAMLLITPQINRQNRRYEIKEEPATEANTTQETQTPQTTQPTQHALPPYYPLWCDYWGFKEWLDEKYPEIVEYHTFDISSQYDIASRCMSSNRIVKALDWLYKNIYMANQDSCMLNDILIEKKERLATTLQKINRGLKKSEIAESKVA